MCAFAEYVDTVHINQICYITLKAMSNEFSEASNFTSIDRFSLQDIPLESFLIIFNQPVEAAYAPDQHSNNLVLQHCCTLCTVLVYKPLCIQ